jgi:PIN domain nuclease of toxin-antitoxin system
MTVVLDASTLLASLMVEPGAEILAEPMLASVNRVEVGQKSISAAGEVEGMPEDLEVLGLKVEPFLALVGDTVGRLWELTRQARLSLQDHAYPGLGLRLGVTLHSWI